MSTIAQVEAAWNTAIWQHASIKALSSNIFKYEMSDTSDKQLSQLSYKKKINFFEVVTTRSIDSNEIGNALGAIVRFDVEIRYTREQDPNGETFAAVRDAIILLQSLVRSELGTNWSSTIDYYIEQSDGVEISEALIQSIKVWRCVYRFQGFQTISSL